MGFKVFLACVLAVFSLPSALAADLNVEVRIEGIERRSERNELLDASRVALNPDGYTTLAPLRRAAQRDASTIQGLLRSQGYYAATVSSTVQRDGLDVEVIFAVDRGERFSISNYRIEYLDQIEGERPQSFEEIGEETEGDPTGGTLSGLQAALLTWLWNHGYPTAEPGDRRVEADLSAGSATAVFPIRTGPKAYFGDVEVEGDEETLTSYIRALRPFEAGEEYTREGIDTYRRRLAETALFTDISINPEEPDPDGRTDVVVSVVERQHRTIGAGLSYATDIGIGATAYWENRNIFGGGEKLAARLAYAVPLQEAELTFQKPLPRFPGSWRLSALLENEDTDAFEAQTATVGAGLTKYLFERDLELNGGIRYQYSVITDRDGTEETFSSASFPVAAIINTENDPLNPTTGYRARLKAEPFFFDTNFTKIELGGASRIGFGENNRVLFAGRALVGGIAGTDFEGLPATERYFAGGGGSVRGYGYQLAGELDENGDPIGGSSKIEVNAEARVKVTPSIQIAAFADGGTTYRTKTPFGENPNGDVTELLIGAGLGVRYFTPIGPIRLDVAVPLDRRRIFETSINEETGDPEQTVQYEDDPFQVYIAVGQPF